MKISKLVKVFTLIKITVQEVLCKSVVVKMSVAFNSRGAIIKSNWGDDINYWLLRELSDKPIIPFSLSIVTRFFRKPYIAGIGSILTMFDMDNAIIWGTGVISNSGKIVGHPKEVRAVRGPLTREKLIEQGIDCPEVYGDPALLLPLYYVPKVDRKYKLGVICCYDEFDHPFVKRAKVTDEVLFIDIAHYNHWLDFPDQICQCECIVSSSLHGLIISQAYNIPNVWMRLSDVEYGDEIKYHDFFISVGKDRQYMMVYENTSLDEIIKNTEDYLPSMIDLTPLLNTCPFEIKNCLKIQH